jgi:hypothetical protein
MSKASRQTPTELIERYLQAVAFWLPKGQQQDIIAELSEDLHSQIEEKETELGRSLSETEIEAVLKQRGRPVLVANRYLPQRSLIGPVLFPIYWFVIKVVALSYLVPWVLVWLGMMSFSSSYRAEHTSAGWFGAIGSAWSAWWFTAVIALGTVTLLFAVLEQVQAKSRLLENWSPRKLPPVRNPNQIPRAGSVIEVVVNLMFSVWWIDIMSSPVILDRPEIKIVLSPVWRYLFWGFLLLALINAVAAGVNLARPYWTVVRAFIRLTTNGAASALFCWMLNAGALAQISGAGLTAARALDVTNAVNAGLAKTLPLVLATAVVIAIVDVRRILRAKNVVPVPLNGKVSAAVV